MKLRNSGVIFLVAMIGCIEAGPVRHNYKGTVTYQGEPVPYGMIYFDPDESKGNHGVQGNGEIIDGKYETASGQGVVGGPMRVRIIGFDGIPPAGPEADMFPHGKELFSEQVISVDLPLGSGTHDFNLP